MDSIELALSIRKHGIEMTHISHGSHIASVLSVADIIAVLYADVLKYDKDDPALKDRDIFILSKGHAGAAVYSALAECGFFNVEKLKTHYADGSKLSGHVSHKGVPGVEYSTGSLGHGLSVGAGMAKADQMDGRTNGVFVVMGDGECNEGSVWEAALFASQHRLDNLTVVIDHNNMQGLGFCKDILCMEPLADKWRDFGWHVITADGHDHKALKNAFEEARIRRGRPNCIIANTVKGKGVSFMENDILWHYRDPQGEFYTSALKELEDDDA